MITAMVTLLDCRSLKDAQQNPYGEVALVASPSTRAAHNVQTFCDTYTSVRNTAAWHFCIECQVAHISRPAQYIY